jgi:hypothetical protein
VNEHLLRPIDAGHQALSMEVVAQGGWPRLEGEVIQTRRLAPQTEQIHAEKPRWRFFELPM